MQGLFSGPRPGTVHVETREYHHWRVLVAVKQGYDHKLVMTTEVVRMCRHHPNTWSLSSRLEKLAHSFPMGIFIHRDVVIEVVRVVYGIDIMTVCTYGCIGWLRCRASQSTVRKHIEVPDRVQLGVLRTVVLTANLQRINCVGDTRQ